MQLQTDQAALHAALADGATLVTANARLASRLLTDYARERQAAGQAVWTRPAIFAWQGWLRQLYSDALACGAADLAQPRALLSPTQADSVWQQIIADDQADGYPAVGPLLQPAALASLAAEARSLLSGWLLHEILAGSTEASEEVAAFRRWNRAWENRLQREAWLEETELPEQLAEWLRQLPELQPKSLWLAGFEEISPQQAAFFGQLDELGTRLHRFVPAPVPGSSARSLACADSRAEMRAAAAWARRQLDQDPERHIGIVVADLATCRNELLRELDRSLDPPSRRHPVTVRQPPWNVSLGEALLEQPLVYDAFLLLGLASGPQDFASFSRLLRSPFFGRALEEQEPRIKLELQLRQRGELQLDIATLSWLAEQPELLCPDLSSRLQSLLVRQRELPRRQSAGRWAQSFADWLGGFGWPGERPLDSHEFQVLVAWQDLLQDFAALGSVQPAVGLADAIGQLRRLAAGRLFQPRSAAAPVQVLGMLEAIGQRFDALWVMGLHDGIWPAIPRPNPLLPIAMQRAHELPRATARRELDFAARLTSQLRGAAAEVIFSWPQQHGDELLRPSPLITELPVSDPQPLPVQPWRDMQQQAGIEQFCDGAGPPLPDGQQRMRGGTGVLRDQSACAFRAFARHRLAAGALESPAPGLDPRQRGVLVHEALEKLWSVLGGQAQLCAMDEVAIGQLLSDCARLPLQRMAGKYPRLFGPRFMQVEQARLEQLLQEWLDCERSRAPFAVTATELKVNLSVGRLELSGQIDRIDELADGRRVLVDYKTGSLKTSAWIGARPQDPQLPLYLVYSASDAAALAIGQVTAGSCKWSGLARTEDIGEGFVQVGQKGPTKGLSWADLVADWQSMGEGLAAAFSAGQASVDPLPQACSYCHLSALCRINDQGNSLLREERSEASAGTPDD